MAYGNAIAAFTVIFTMLSAYLVVAYFVGKRLSFSQIAIINTFFTISVVVTPVTLRSILSITLLRRISRFNMLAACSFECIVYLC